MQKEIDDASNSLSEIRAYHALLREIGRRIRGHRSRRSLSRHTIARRCKVREATLGRWERGDSAPRIDHLLALADLFEVTLDLLVRGPRSRRLNPPPARPR